MDNSSLTELYESPEQRLNTLVQLNNAANVMRVFKAVKQEFPDEYKRNPHEIIKFMVDTYGIRMHWVNIEGQAVGWGTTYEVVDEVKYTFFLLKYTK